MMNPMDRTPPLRAKLTRLAVQTLTPVASLLFTLVAAAQEETTSYDARLERYPGKVTLDSGGTALTWLLVILLAGLCVGTLLKNANRTHLD